MPDSILHIPAKATSVRLPGKNFADVGGKPSIVHVVEAAQDSQCFDEIVITSDEDAGLIFAIFRDKRFREVQLLPQTPSSVIQTTHEMIAGLGWVRPYLVHISIMLPTIALVTQEDIEGVFDLATETGDPVMAVSRFPYRMDEVICIREDEHIYRPLAHLPIKDEDAIPLFIDVGGIYSFPPGTFQGVQSMYVPNLRPYVIPRYRGVDVDEEEDLEMVRRLWNGSHIAQSSR